VLRTTALSTHSEQQFAPDGASPRLSALDGLRGIAVIVVFFFHFTGSPVGGYLGVDLFFVLSGYLITNVLLNSSEELPPLKTWQMFYYGRAFRILPALLEMFGLYAAIKLIFPGQVTMFRENIMSSLFMYSNWTRAFKYPYPDYLGHTWSLSIEEQFYLVWPILLLGLLKLRLKNAALSAVTGGLVFTLWISRFIMAGYHPDADRLYNGTDTRIDAILIGCLAAFAGRMPGFRGKVLRYKKLSVGALVAASAIGVWLMTTINWMDLWLYQYGLCLFTFSSAAVVLYLVTFPNGIASRCFGWKPLVYAGRRSYAIYLFHLPIFVCLTSIYKITPGWKSAAIGAGPTLLLAIASWRYIEQPALRFKNKKYDRVLKAFQTSAAN
jgi:peptidoglycan/LPS O-acetylase OafA/YrhL